jgi:hypothetical protein
MLEIQADRKIELASKIIEHWDAGKPLSSVLSRIKILAEMFGDKFMSARAELAIHGIIHTPNIAKRCHDDPIFLNAAESHMEFCHTEDPREITVAKAMEYFNKGEGPPLNWCYSGSVYELENVDPPPKLLSGMHNIDYDTSLKLKTIHKYHTLILYRMQQYFFEYVNNKLLEAQTEKDRLNLLGPDYNIVLSSLGALDTMVGEELEAALNLLSSNKAADWSLCVLGCRNVVIKLGKLLWKVPGKTYFSNLSGKELDLSGDKEKNKLYAYIDYKWRNATDEERQLLEEAQKLVPRIWNIGSKGKTGKVRFSEAQNLVIETFHFADLLDKTTGLISVSKLD